MSGGDDRWCRNEPAVVAQRADRDLDRGRRPLAVARQRFDRVHPCVRWEQPLQHGRLGPVTLLRARSVSVDEPHRGSRYPRIAQGVPETAGQLYEIRVDGGHVVSVVGHRATQEEYIRLSHTARQYETYR